MLITACFSAAAGILEHTFSTREGDEQRAVLSFPPTIAPYKAVVLPLDARIPRTGVVGELTLSPQQANLEHFALPAARVRREHLVPSSSSNPSLVCLID